MLQLSAQTGVASRLLLFYLFIFLHQWEALICCQLVQLAVLKSLALLSALLWMKHFSSLVPLPAFNGCRKGSISFAASHQLTKDCISVHQPALCLNLLKSTLDLI